MSTVPKAITPALLAFCGGVSDHRPTYVPSKPSADAETSACFDNVARKIRRAGGEIAYGWAIWHIPGLYFEAEHHGVWRNRGQALVDVSPQLGQVRRILFLPDPAAVYDPASFRPNVIAAVDGSTIATEFADLANARNALIDCYRAERTVAMLTPTDQMRLGLIDRRMKELWSVAGVAI